VPPPQNQHLGKAVGDSIQFSVSRLPRARAERNPGGVARRHFLKPGGDGLLHLVEMIASGTSVDRFAARRVEVGLLCKPVRRRRQGHGQEAVQPDEFKHHPWRIQWQGPARKPGATHGEAVRRQVFKVNLLELVLPEEFPDRRNLLPPFVQHDVPAPDRAAPRFAEHGQAGDQTGNVFVAQMTEEAGKQDEVCGNVSLVIACHRRIGLHIAQLRRQAGLLRRRPAPGDGLCMIVQQGGRDILPPGMIGQRTDHVTPVASTHTDNLDRAGRTSLEGGGNLLANDPQPRLQARQRVILLMPFVPIHRTPSTRDTVNRLQAGVKEPIPFAVFGRAEARSLPTAKRQRHVRTGGGGVELEHARLGVVQEPLPQVLALTEERGHQALPHAVAQRQRVIEIVGALHDQQG
jgi:hypothetical protein